MSDGRVRSHFFNAVWIYGAVAVLLTGVAIEQPALSALALLALVTAGASLLLGRWSLERLRYTRELSARRVFRGESVTLTATISNQKWLPLPWIEVEDLVSDRIRLRNQETLPSARPGVTVFRITTSLGPRERVSWTFEIDCPHRGAFPFGPVTLRSGDLFGFFSRQEQLDISDRLLVYPRIVPLGELTLPPLQPFGAVRVPRHLLTDPSRTIGVREYRPEDSFRHIHWKATARMQELQVKLFEPTVSVQLGIFLNLDTYERYWEGIDYERAEGAITAAASIAAFAIDEQYAVGVYANGVIAGSDQSLRIPPGRGPNQLPAIMEGLAKLTPLAATSFPRLLREEARAFPWGSTVMVVTALMTGALAEALAMLLGQGHRVTLIRIGEIEAPPLDRLEVHTLAPEALGQPAGEPAHYARLIGEQVRDPR